MQNEETLANFLAITGCKDPQKAQEYLVMGEFKLEQAIALYMELEETGAAQQPVARPPRQDQEEKQFVQEYNTQLFNSTNPAPNLIKQQSQPNPILVQEYRKFQEEKTANDDGIVKKVISGTVSMFKGLFSKPPDYGSEFLNYMHMQHIPNELQFNMGNFVENLRNAQEGMRPLLLYLHEPLVNQLLKTLTQQKALCLVINKNYHCLGLIRSPVTMEQIPLEVSAQPSLVVIRRDLFDKIQIMESFELSEQTDFDGLAAKLKQTKGLYNKTYIMEEQIKREALNHNRIQYMPNPMAQQQQQQQQSMRQDQIKMQNERELRRQQEEAYKQAEELQRRKQREVEERQKQELLAQTNKAKEQEENQFKKAQILSNLPNEPENNESAICVQFRLPNGGTVNRRFNVADSIRVLFEFVSCQPDDCFDDPMAQLDLIQNFPRLSLKGIKDKLISEVFEGSNNEQLIVEEVTQ